MPFFLFWNENSIIKLLFSNNSQEQIDDCAIHDIGSFWFFSWLGCPAPRYYGLNCSLPCPQNCQEGRCNIVDGSCLGCVPGYNGLFCDTGLETKEITLFNTSYLSIHWDFGCFLLIHTTCVFTDDIRYIYRMLTFFQQSNVFQKIMF